MNFVDTPQKSTTVTRSHEIRPRGVVTITTAITVAIIVIAVVFGDARQCLNTREHRRYVTDGRGFSACMVQDEATGKWVRQSILSEGYAVLFLRSLGFVI